MVAYEAELNVCHVVFQGYSCDLQTYLRTDIGRQCLCCFKEYKHLEVFNQVVYALINLVVAQVQALQDQLYKSCTNDTDSDWADVTQQSDEPVNVERDSNEEDGETEGQNTTESKPDSSKACGRTGDVSKSPDPFSAWNTEEKEKLLLCVAKIFQIQFPLYTAYKHNTHPTIELTWIVWCSTRAPALSVSALRRLVLWARCMLRTSTLGASVHAPRRSVPRCLCARSSTLGASVHAPRRSVLGASVHAPRRSRCSVPRCTHLDARCSVPQCTHLDALGARCLGARTSTLGASVLSASVHAPRRSVLGALTPTLGAWCLGACALTLGARCLGARTSTLGARCTHPDTRRLVPRCMRLDARCSVPRCTHLDASALGASVHAPRRFDAWRIDASTLGARTSTLRRFDARCTYLDARRSARRRLNARCTHLDA
ncbi:UNVERIFIED_CONTAM: hypothetical protein FKN15_017489 [Acipenser sinensis]